MGYIPEDKGSWFSFEGIIISTSSNEFQYIFTWDYLNALLEVSNDDDDDTSELVDRLHEIGLYYKYQEESSAMATRMFNVIC